MTDASTALGSKSPQWQNRAFSYTVPAGTTQAVPLVEAADFTAYWLDTFSVRFPAGVAGLVGLQVWLAGTQLLPIESAGQWVIGSDERLRFEVGVELGQVQVKLYNLGNYPHTLRGFWKITPVVNDQAGAAGLVALSASAIEAAAPVDLSGLAGVVTGASA